MVQLERQVALYHVHSCLVEHLGSAPQALGPINGLPLLQVDVRVKRLCFFLEGQQNRVLLVDDFDVFAVGHLRARACWVGRERLGPRRLEDPLGELCLRLGDTLAHIVKVCLDPVELFLYTFVRCDRIGNFL